MLKDISLLTMILAAPVSMAHNDTTDPGYTNENDKIIDTIIHFHIMGNETELQCIENAALDCTPSTHTYHSCLFCGMIEKKGPTFHHRVNHDWSVGWAGQTCKECGRVEVF